MWNCYIDYNGGTNNYNITNDFNVYADSTELEEVIYGVSAVFRAYSTDISRDGYKFKGFEFYIDGVKKEIADLIELGRLEKTSSVNENYKVYMSVDKNGNALPGDVHIKVLWEQA